MNDPSFHVIPADEHQHLANWDCYCAPEPFEIDVLAGPIYRHKAAPSVELQEGRQCAVFECPEPGTGFTDDQQWVCTRHAVKRGDKSCTCETVEPLPGQFVAIHGECVEHATAGDGPCMDCGTLDTPVWFTDNVVWNRVVGGPDTQYDPGGFLCPWCFTQRAYAAGLSPTGWRLIPEFHWETATERRERTS